MTKYCVCEIKKIELRKMHLGVVSEEIGNFNKCNIKNFIKLQKSQCLNLFVVHVKYTYT